MSAMRFGVSAGKSSSTRKVRGVERRDQRRGYSSVSSSRQPASSSFVSKRCLLCSERSSRMPATRSPSALPCDAAPAAVTWTDRRYSGRSGEGCSCDADAMRWILLSLRVHLTSTLNPSNRKSCSSRSAPAHALTTSGAVTCVMACSRKSSSPKRPICCSSVSRRLRSSSSWNERRPSATASVNEVPLTTRSTIAAITRYAS